MLRLALFFGAIGLLLLASCAFVTWIASVLGGMIGIGSESNWPILIALGFGIGGVVTLFFAGLRRLGAPLGDLIEAADRVESGDYAVAVPERGPREVRALARSFNAMVGRLRSNESQRSALLADVTHELRTPLTVIQGNLEGLVDGVYPADPEHLGPILDEIRQLSRLLDDLRTLSEAEAGGLRLRLEPSDLGVLTEEAAAVFRQSALEDGVHLNVDIPADFPLIDADPGRLRQILVNLLANALRFSPPGGEVYVEARRLDGNSVEIAVRDEGPGIPQDALPHIFDRFTKSPDSPGSGLGLAIARRLAEAHGGRLEAESALGQGTTMRLMLPVDA
jgi:two-component system sensor histidine kinase BaeS